MDYLGDNEDDLMRDSDFAREPADMRRPNLSALRAYDQRLKRLLDAQNDDFSVDEHFAPRRRRA